MQAAEPITLPPSGVQHTQSEDSMGLLKLMTEDVKTALERDPAIQIVEIRRLQDS